MDRDPLAVGAQVRMRMPRLTPLEGQTVDTIMRRPDLNAETPLQSIAEEAGVSNAMIVKIAKKLGFSGFRDLRTALVTYRDSDVASLHAEISADDSSIDIVRKVFNTAMQAMTETMSIVDIEAFDRAVDLIAAAKTRDFYGLGGSAQIARDVSHKFLRIGLRSTVYDDAHMMLMSAALLEHQDLAIAVTHSGETPSVLEAMQLARSRGARTIALTNYAGSSAATMADVTLYSTAQGSPILGENAAARIGQLCIMDAIFAAVAQRDLKRSERDLTKTMNAVSRPRRK